MHNWSLNGRWQPAWWPDSLVKAEIEDHGHFLLSDAIYVLYTDMIPAHARLLHSVHQHVYTSPLRSMLPCLPSEYLVR